MTIPRTIEIQDFKSRVPGIYNSGLIVMDQTTTEFCELFVDLMTGVLFLQQELNRIRFGHKEQAR